jgi:uncharacterized protein
MLGRVKGLAAGLFWALLAVSALAQQLRPLPPLLRTLSDEVGALSVEQGRALSLSAEEIFERTGVRVIIVIAETTRPEEIEDYTERLGQRWKRERDIAPERSIFVVLSVKDREFQVMPGKGLESIDRQLKKPEAYAGLAPLFREGRYFDALMTVNHRLLNMLLGRRNGG